MSRKSKNVNYVRTLLFLCFHCSAVPAFAEAIQLGDYLNTMDRTEVLFSGHIKYDGSYGRDSFTFYDENHGDFRVIFDTGRDEREHIETNCEESSVILFSYSDLCTISGSGTIEIRGSRIYISIETVEHVGQ